MEKFHIEFAAKFKEIIRFMHQHETFTVLIVDDEENRLLLHEHAVTRALTDMHFKINFILFTDPDEAIEAIRNTRNCIALVLTDLNMNKDVRQKEGIRVVEACSESNIPVILVTDTISSIDEDSLIGGVDDVETHRKTELGDRLRSICAACLGKTPLKDIGDRARKALLGDTDTVNEPSSSYFFVHPTDAALQEA